MDASRQRELIDALLPQTEGGDDCGLAAAELEELRAAMAQDPRFAAEMRRVQAWDRQLSPALDDVPIPAGLADRLLAAVRAEVPQTETSTIIAPAKPAGGVSRRRALWGIGIVAGIAASLLLAIFLRPSPTIYLESAALLDEIRQELPALSDQWLTELASASPATHPVDDLALAASARRWQSIDTSLDHQAVVYDLALPGRKRAMLIVMKRERVESDLPSLPARGPLSNTEGVCLGAWQRDGLIYVLVVEGTPARFGSFLKEFSTG